MIQTCSNLRLHARARALPCKGSDGQVAIVFPVVAVVMIATRMGKEPGIVCRGRKTHGTADESSVLSRGADTQPLAREAERQRQRVLRRVSRHSNGATRVLLHLAAWL
jgi:hypothetical protein